MTDLLLTAILVMLALDLIARFWAIGLFLRAQHRARSERRRAEVIERMRAAAWR